MGLYPSLSDEQQRSLPKLIKATAQAAMFEDSTHQLWRCDTVAGEMMLKLCNTENVRSSSFWQGMALLFKVDLPRQLGEFSQVYQQISDLSPLLIPDYIAASSQRRDDSAFILNKVVAGTMVTADVIDNDMVEKLAQHISQLHQQQQATYGTLLDVNLSVQNWSQQLQSTLKQLAEDHVIPAELLMNALSQAALLSVDSFVPVMLDLRWDQFLHDEGALSVLVDLDAFVFAPRELEFVLLEYLLDQQQAEVFMQQYRQSHTIPDLSIVRTAYRLLLFMMNVLGEHDIDIWMQAPKRW
ncbi:MAG: hypothetical protein HRT92_08495 [Piscirickettsiaceae bacterium]|nr:hypothetical protein [Piscirickettsiaceae bacterium]